MIAVPSCPHGSPLSCTHARLNTNCDLTLKWSAIISVPSINLRTWILQSLTVFKYLTMYGWGSCICLYLLSDTWCQGTLVFHRWTSRVEWNNNNRGLVVCAGWTLCFNLCKHKLTSIQQEANWQAGPTCMLLCLYKCLYAFMPLNTDAAIFGFH